MPELPEVETVRDGVARHVRGARVVDVEVRRESVARRQDGGPDALAGALRGRYLDAAVRRGKFLWVLLSEAGTATGGTALLAHLGMSGQLLVRGPGPLPEHPHLRARLHLEPPEVVPGEAGPGGDEAISMVEPAVALDFVDQRTFGHLSVVDLVPTPDGAPGGRGSDLAAVPVPVAHIARDLLDPALDRGAVVAALRRRRTEIKRALLDQTLVSGIGNIYADEALWRAGVHPRRPTATMRPGTAHAVLDAAEDVMTDALVAGGTSFDALYVNVNGASGYFDRSLAVYGQTGRPCPRCGAPVVRDAFMNRSSHVCPACQPAPRGARRTARGVPITPRRSGAS